MAAPGDLTSERIRRAGWRQGSIIDKADLPALNVAVESADLAVVLSQDCDLLQPLELEPVVELLPGTRIRAPRGDLLYGRNPRLLDLVLTEGAGGVPATFRACDRVFVPKERLAGAAKPSASLSLSEEALRCLRGWIVRRYVRAAFPDAFNERLEQVRSRLERLSKSGDSEVVSGIYALLVEREAELPEGQDYHLDIWLAVEPATLEDARAYGMAVAYEQRLKDILQACTGIRLQGIEVRSEADISLDDLRLLRRLDLDYRSHAPKPGGALPPEGV